MSNTELFKRNLEVLRGRQKVLAHLVENLSYVHTKLIETEYDGVKGYNLDLGSTLFYNENPINLVQKQVDKYLENPSRIHGGWLFKPVAPWTVTEFLYEKACHWADEHGIMQRPTAKPEDGGIAIILGLGLGYHIERLIDELDCRIFYIAEEHIEFLYHFMHLQDLEKIYKKLAERGGDIRFLIEEDPDTVVAQINVTIRQNDFGIVDGAFFFTHYQSKTMLDIRTKYVEAIPLMNMNPGFFDDECVMMRNSFANLTNEKVSLYRIGGKLKKNTPAIIVGSGPSLDGCIELIKNKRNEIIVFSCGTALGALLRNGIRPDYHVELENTSGPPQIVKDLKDGYGLDGIDLIAPTTVRPEMVEMFDRSILFYRDSVTATHFWGERDTVSLAAPTVSNTGARIAAGLGFENIYLVGVDLGAREPDSHHSKDSIYLADETFLENSPAHAAASKYNNVQRGNLGGNVYTNTSFQASAVAMGHLFILFPTIKLVNLSDGIRIKGTIPCLPEVVRLSGTEKEAAYEKKLITKEFEATRNSFDLSLDELLRLQSELLFDCENIKKVFDKHFVGEFDVYAFYRDIKSCLFYSASDKFKRVRHAMYYGTYMLIFQLAFIVVRRVKDQPEIFNSYMEFYKRESIASLNEVQRQTIELMEELVERGEHYLQKKEQ
ncbi:6-hydroxymethylpterin diphosphokinase MptE-like protein [Curvivirga sp.]|uniref:motility associated factor glycosyltransferase family protein n=1 Tax=Curvivirga sp. TaxID=2856848 RepID=UPI003B5C5299